MTSPSQSYESQARGVRALLPNDEFERSTTQYLVGTLESAAILFQAVTLGLSTAVDPYMPPGRTIIAGLAIAHLVAAYVVSRTAGPFARGGYLMALWVALAFVVPVLGASMIERGSYAIGIGGTQLCVYANGPVLIAAFYPWTSRARQSLRWSAEVLFLLGLAATPFMLIGIFNSNPQQINYISATVSFVWILVAYILGKSVGRMCRAAAQRQIEIQQQSYDEFFNFLHSHVKAGVAAIKAEWGDDAAMREKLSELEQAVSDRRIELLLARQQVPLATLISERIRAFTGVIEITESPRVGAITVSRLVGILVSRALGDLMNNAALHGGDSVAIRLNANASGVALDVIDDGPGFDSLLVLHDESRSLCRLRRDIEQAGGSLRVCPAEPSGTHVHLFVPIQSSPTKEVRHARIAR